ncbi:MAG: HDOD domain-containing protein [Fimbriimonadaceae bacterium]|jgi:HD-like signal output (HDOD) protein|nr:HDOD domain-containing protein [Fimbriimonadaceae bacterium]
MALRSENFLLRRYIDKAMVDLPALPGVVLQVVQATEKENVTTAEIEGLLSTDPAIATKLLKVVNSAYFGLPRQIVNVNQTVAILGMHQVRNLVMSIGVLNVLTSTTPRVAEAQKAHWGHSFASASCAESIARAKNLPRKDIEMIFIGGLLHDVGRLFLFTLFHLPYQEVMKESIKKGEPIDEVERRILGTTHAELGGTLAEKWNFPQGLVNMIRHHDQIPDNMIDPGVYCCHVADAIANELAGPEVVGVFRPAHLRAQQWLGFSDEQWEGLKTHTSEQVEKAKDMLGVA